MPYSEHLAVRIRSLLTPHLSPSAVQYSEMKMFGGLAFLRNGHMFVGVIADDLMARVGKQAYETALTLPHARVMDFNGRPMAGYVFVAAEGIGRDTDLRQWMDRAEDFVASLPPKAAGASTDDEEQGAERRSTTRRRTRP
jgi:TfoX/Sxy family transcriptional regulator of competence genes